MAEEKLPKNITATALRIISKKFMKEQFWPEDEWIVLTKEYDLNLWMDGTHMVGTVYKNKSKGEDRWWEVFNFENKRLG